MSVIIKGMEMPRTCYDCKLRRRNGLELICPVLERSYKIADTQVLFVREKDCPLIEVQEPHGRLIDADALVEDLKRQCEEVFKIDAVSPDDFWITRDQAYNERLWKTWCESFYKYLESRPTVIPAIEEAE